MHYLKFSLKKFISTILLCFVLFGIFTPLTHAQETTTPIWAKWYNSSLDKTFFEIPPDDRNLEDFIFTDQKIQYRNWTDNADSWISENAKITSSMIWYNNYLDVKDPWNGITVITNKEISNFFVVVNNKYYNTDWEFSFPIDYNGNYRLYMYWEVDEDQNYCLYLDLNNKWQEKYKIKNSCHMKLLDREPFLLFFQVERVWYEKPSRYNQYNVNFNQNLYEEPYYRISVTLPYLITHEEKKYVTFHKAEDFMISSLLEKYKQYYPFPNFYWSFKLADGKMLQNSISSRVFNRRWNQQAFRPYSFSFIEDYIKRYDQLKSENSDRCIQGSNTCQISLPVDGTSYFESFVLSVAAQYYNSPVVTNDKTYIGVPPVITWEGFKPLEYENCDTLAIWCHISNLGKTFYNTIWKFFSNIWNWFADIIKGIFTWLWEGVKWFFEPIIKPIYDFFVNAYKIISENITDLQKISFTWTMETCREFNEIDEKQATIASSLVNLISLAIPFAPADGGEVCTFDGRKIVDYKENTKFLDTILIMSAFMSIIFTFTSWISKHD